MPLLPWVGPADSATRLRAILIILAPPILWPLSLGPVALGGVERVRAGLAGKVKGCIQCHSGAKGDDFIYTNGKRGN